MNKLPTLLLVVACLAAARGARSQTLTDSLERTAERARTPRAKAEAFCDLCVQMYYADSNHSALRAGRLGLHYARQAGDDQKAAECWLCLGQTRAYLADYDSALICLEQSLRLSQKTGHKEGQLQARRNLGRLFFHQDLYAKALDNYEAALDLAAAAGRKDQEAGIYSEIGTVFYSWSRHAAALEYYYKGLNLFAALDDAAGQFDVWGNIGDVYLSREEFDKALECYRKARDLLQGGANAIERATVELSIGMVYWSTSAYDSALARFEQALAVFEKERKQYGRSAALNNIANIYAERGDHRKALEYYRESLAINRALKDRYGVAITLANIADSRLSLGDLARAKEEAAEATRISREIGAPEAIIFAAETAAKIDSATGDWKSAYEHYKLYKQYADSARSESQAQKIGRLEAEFDYEQQLAAQARAETEAARRRARLFWIAAGVFALMAAGAGLLGWGYREKRAANRQLALQNAEIRQQREEIFQQRDELRAMNDQISEQRDQLEKAREQITESVQSASSIQRALLPARAALQHGAEVFVYYKPRDVVSGDFYWTRQIDEHTFLYAAADCTGHGVPGGFMSVLGAALLDAIAREYGETRPEEILRLLDRGLRAALKQDAEHRALYDGVDLALVKLDRKNRALVFAGAGRPMYLLRGGEIREYKNGRHSVGGAFRKEKEFASAAVDLLPGDRVFLFTDGVTDQFGGRQGRKFTPKRLKEILLAHQDKDLQGQGAAFAEVFDDWQKSERQLDDQLLIGLRV